jgi:transcriptional regulator with XRE-family HTH domain
MLGTIIRKEREALNEKHKGQYTLKKVGKAIGVSESYVCNIERDKQSASKERLRKLAQHLLIDEDYLLCVAGFITPEMASAVANDKKLFDAMKALCEYGPKKTVIYKLIEGLPQLKDDFLNTGIDDLL